MPHDAPPPIESRSALFLDFDGTLADLRENPDAVVLPDRAHAVLERLDDSLGGAVAILSGRDIRDLARRTPERLWRVGGHGVEICRPMERPGPVQTAAPAPLLDALERLAACSPGVRLEKKGAVLAIHYRAAPEIGPALAAELVAIVGDAAGYTLQAGKLVFEAKPRGADKGLALSALMEFDPFRGRTPVMVGDDATDEDGFAAAKAQGGYGIKVGDGPSDAAFRIPSIEEVWEWLETASA